VEGQRRLTRTLGTVNLDDSSFRQTAHTEGVVEADGAGGDALHLLRLGAKAHDATLAEALFDVT